ncbi:MAG: ferrous iron transport protein A [Anaerolinea sp.]|nr:ferrous iron transport protein A [Anaerolinea sp.]
MIPTQKSPPCFHLSDLAAGEHATVTALGRGKVINNRLTSLGFTPGVVVQMMQNYGRGPLVVAVRGSRVALGRGEAGAIEVVKVDE